MQPIMQQNMLTPVPLTSTGNSSTPAASTATASRSSCTQQHVQRADAHGTSCQTGAQLLPKQHAQHARWHASLAAAGLQHASLAAAGLQHASLAAAGLQHASLAAAGLQHSSAPRRAARHAHQLPATPVSLLASTAACLQRLLLVCGLAGVQVAPVGHAVVHLREA